MGCGGLLGVGKEEVAVGGREAACVVDVVEEVVISTGIGVVNPCAVDAVDGRTVKVTVVASKPGQRVSIRLPDKVSPSKDFESTLSVPQAAMTRDAAS